MSIQQALSKFINDPYNDKTTFDLANLYYDQNQTASALAYYLRVTELDSNLIYPSLLRIGLCLEKQNNRISSVKGLYLHAISHSPLLPEAYFLLSRLYERNKDWQESYTIATIGEQLTTDESQILIDVEYPGRWGFKFEKAVVGWWMGLHDESAHLFRELKKEYNIPHHYKASIESNLQLIGNNWKDPSIYRKHQFSNLRFKFEGASNIEQNYSQCYQDIFVLSMLNGKKNGKYLEIGCADPFYGNNTALLEKEFEWTGISIDIDQSMVDKFALERKNKVIQSDATKINYSELLGDTLNWDYLQIDCDPPTVSYDVLTKIPFHTHKFAVITFEHDHYADDTQSIREKSRKYLKSFGYELMVNDISPDDYSPYEDWWIYPQLAAGRGMQLMRSINDKIKNASKYIYNE